MYLNVPDWYFLNGSNKTGMGYREVNWDLPRERQLILAWQNIFDGTWEKNAEHGLDVRPSDALSWRWRRSDFGAAFRTDLQTVCRSNIPDERMLL
ncbi:hypothetical protein CM49_06074 [Paenibacillus sp. P1XP2]|nr:hypothetical protein CM49_06074 [Paenibacillus sp. P1XP2]